MLRTKYINQQMIDSRMGCNFSFEYSDEELDGVCGVYIIWFGSKCYIGSSVNILERIKQHKSRVISKIKRGDLSGEGSMDKILKHLWLNPKINKATVCVLSKTDRPLLYKTEYNFIEKYRSKNQALNILQ